MELNKGLRASKFFQTRERVVPRLDMPRQLQKHERPAVQSSNFSREINEPSRTISTSRNYQPSIQPTVEAKKRRSSDRTREKLWGRLFDNLERAVDDLYHMIE